MDLSQLENTAASFSGNQIFTEEISQSFSGLSGISQNSQYSVIQDLAKLSGSLSKDPARRAVIKSAKKVNIVRLQKNPLQEFKDFQNLYRSCFGDSCMTSHNKFLNLATPVIVYYAQTNDGSKILGDAVKEFCNPDLDAFIDYLLNCPDDRSFAISKIDNPAFRNMSFQERNELNLIRLSYAKYQLATLLLNLTRALCNVKTYNNKVVSKGYAEGSSKSKGKNWFTASKHNNTAISKEFFDYHTVSITGNNSYQSQAEEKIISFKVPPVALELVEISNFTCFRPLIEFCEASTQGIPFFYEAAQAEQVDISEGIFTSFCGPTNEGTAAKAGTFSQLSQTVNAAAVLTTKVRVSLTIQQKRRDLPMPKVRIIHNLLFKDLTHGITLCEELVTSNLAGLFKSELDIGSNLEYNESKCSEVLHKYFHDNVELLVDPSIIVEGLQNDDTWSLNFGYEMVEADQERIGLLLISSYLKSASFNSYRRERTSVQSRASKNANLMNVLEYFAY